VHMGAATACSSDTTNRPDRGRGMGAATELEVRAGARAMLEHISAAVVEHPGGAISARKPARHPRA